MAAHKYFLILCFLWLFQFQIIAQSPWDLIKDKNGIQVFTRSNTISSFKEFKATMEVEAKMSHFLNVLYDVDGLTDWGYNISESKLLKRQNHFNQIYYAVAKAPWPYKDRDGVYENIITWNKEERVLLVKIEMLEGVLEANDDYVRMDGFGFWKIEKISDERMAITFQMQVDPGGSIKAWMANMFVSDSPYQTLFGLREVLKKEKYQAKTYDFLLE